MAQKPKSTVVRDARLALESCRNHLDAAANSSEFHVRMNAIYDAHDALGRVWENSEHREDPYREIVVLIQGLLLDKKPEQYGVEQIRAIEAALMPTLKQKRVTAQDVEQICSDLMAEKLQVFDILD